MPLPVIPSQNLDLAPCMVQYGYVEDATKCTLVQNNVYTCAHLPKEAHNFTLSSPLVTEAGIADQLSQISPSTTSKIVYYSVLHAHAHQALTTQTTRHPIHAVSASGCACEHSHTIRAQCGDLGECIPACYTCAVSWSASPSVARRRRSFDRLHSHRVQMAD